VKLSRFNTIVDAYGAAPERWPEHERDDALELCRSSLTAARLLAQARSLDRTLKSSPLSAVAVHPSRIAVLRADIAAAARPIARNWFGNWFGFDVTLSQLWPSAAGLALATVLGFGVGLGGLLHVDADHDVQEVRILSSLDLATSNP
jgi:hypothetical protein